MRTLGDSIGVDQSGLASASDTGEVSGTLESQARRNSRTPSSIAPKRKRKISNASFWGLRQGPFIPCLGKRSSARLKYPDMRLPNGITGILGSGYFGLVST